MDWITACGILDVPLDASEQQIKEQRNYWLNVLHPDKTVGLPSRIKEKADKDFIEKKVAWEYLLKPEHRPMGRPSSSTQKTSYESSTDKPRNEATSPPKPKPVLALTPRHIRFKDLAYLEIKTTYFDIKNIGGPYANFSIVKDLLPNWLDITDIKRLTSEALPVRVTIKATGQQLGSKHECYIPIRVESKDLKFTEETKIHIELIMKDSFLQIDKKLVEFHIVPGITGPVQTINILNTGIGYIEGNLVPREEWVKISPRSLGFRNSQNIQLQIDVAKLTGDRITIIDVNTNAGYEQVIVKATLHFQKTQQTTPKKAESSVLNPFTVHFCPKCKGRTVWFNKKADRFECTKHPILHHWKRLSDFT